MKNMIFAVLVYGCITISSLALDNGATDNSAVFVIEGLQAALIDVMKRAEELGYSGRYETLAPVIQSTHALSKIAKVAVGRYWRQFDEEQRSLLVETFREFCVSNYASMFDGYSGEQFKIIEEEEQKPGRTLVRTALIKSDGEEIDLDYILDQHDGSWRIINITTNGISDLALKRAEYTSVIEKEGFEVLLAKLNQKIRDFSKISQASWNVE